MQLPSFHTIIKLTLNLIHTVLQIECLGILLPGLPCKSRITWAPSPDENVLYAVDMSFKGM